MDETLQAQLNTMKEVELLIGIPSYNNARTIGQVAKTAVLGLAKHFPKVKAVLVISDGGSTDASLDEVRKVPLEDLELVLTAHPVDPVHKMAPPPTTEFLEKRTRSGTFSKSPRG